MQKSLKVSVLLLILSMSLLTVSGNEIVIHSSSTQDTIIKISDLKKITFDSLAKVNYELAVESSKSDYTTIDLSKADSMKISSDSEQCSVLTYSDISVKTNYLLPNRKMYFLKTTSVDSRSKSKLSSYPNPFSESVKINLGDLKYHSIEIRDVFGKCVKVFSNSELEYGSGTLYWDGCTDYGSTVPNGVYFLIMKSDTTFDIEKIIKK